jgi:hypothetical protein
MTNAFQPDAIGSIVPIFGSTAAAGGIIFIPTDIKIALYTAVAGDAVLVNPTAGGFTINFPAVPVAGNQIRVSNVTSSLNTITLDGGAIDVEDPDLSLASMGTTATLTGDGFSYDFMYTGGLWKVV